MDYKLKNESKMRSYLQQRTNKKLTNKEFKDCIDNFVYVAEYINEETEGKGLIKESASLEVEIDDEIYEVFVNYNYMYENGNKYALIDFDYGYEPPLI